MSNHSFDAVVSFYAFIFLVLIAVLAFSFKMTGQTPDVPEYTSVLRTQYGLITAENSCKFHPIEPQQDQFDFSACDWLEQW